MVITARAQPSAGFPLIATSFDSYPTLKLMTNLSIGYLTPTREAIPKEEVAPGRSQTTSPSVASHPDDDGSHRLRFPTWTGKALEDTNSKNRIG